MARRSKDRLMVPHQGVEHVELRLDEPESGDARGIFVLAHGSGAPLDSAFLEAIAPMIADTARLCVLRFNYGYAELMRRSGKPRPPEKRSTLEAVHREALRHAHSAFPDLPLIAGGKSLGGRISSLMVAEGSAPDVRALIFLGYPLHPQGKPERRRSDHFGDLSVPMLFLQGTRDALCRLELLEEEWPKLPAAKATLHKVEGGDHSFDVLKKSGRKPEDVRAEIAAIVAEWTGTTLG